MTRELCFENLPELREKNIQKDDVKYRLLDFVKNLETAKDAFENLEFEFRFSLEKRIAEVNDPYMNITSPMKVYFDNKGKQAVELTEDGTFTLPNGITSDSGKIYLKEGADYKQCSYKVLKWIISDLKLIGVSDEEEDNALDCIFQAQKLHIKGDDKSLTIIDSNQKKQLITLNEAPKADILCARYDTYQIRKQIAALNTLIKRPQKHHIPLLNLLGNSRTNLWEETDVRELPCYETTQTLTDEQKTAVCQALATNDFSFIEGPPGSGKTTVLLEIIVQEIIRGKKIMVSASTHVALDNILDRLIMGNFLEKYGISPIRIGYDGNISELSRRYSLNNIAKTELKRLRKAYEKKSELSAAQKKFKRHLMGADAESAIKKLILDTSNVVFGTNIGILQAPMIKENTNALSQPFFDVLIVDEASKTTFTEFLVPAVHCKKFILSGDRRQLAPYTDESVIQKIITNVLSDDDKKICKAVYDVAHGRNEQKNGRIVVCEDINSFDKMQQKIDEQIRGLDGKNMKLVTFTACRQSPVSKSEKYQMLGSNLLLVTEKVLNELLPILPPYYNIADVPKNERKRYGGLRNAYLGNLEEEDLDPWDHAIAWRECRVAELKHSIGSSSIERYKNEVELLCPKWEGGKETLDEIHKNTSVSLSSILDIFEDGYTPSMKKKYEYALISGMKGNKEVWSARHTLLSEQRRMHSEIAAFPSKYIYEGTALKTAEGLDTYRQLPGWQDSSRVMWITVEPKEKCKNKNPTEVKAILDELEDVIKYARNHPHDSGWSIALLSFYKGQMKKLIASVKKTFVESGKFSGNYQEFKSKEDNISIIISTVDRFQGQEADFVFLSFVRNKSGDGFLDNMNRLNVALTRARYQLYLVGSRKNFSKNKTAGILKKLIEYTEDKNRTKTIQYR